MPFNPDLLKPNLTAAERAHVLGEMYLYTATDIVPLFLLESFITGTFYAFVTLMTYLLWTNLHSRRFLISLLWILLTAITTHWTLTLRQIESSLTGRPLGVSLTNHELGALSSSLDQYDSAGFWSYYYGGIPLLSFLPLVTETVLVGCTSSLFAFAVVLNIRPFWSRRPSCLSLTIPAMALLMYSISATHWALWLWFFYVWVKPEADPGYPYTLQLKLRFIILMLLSINSLTSDSIVLWRMCVVWGNSRLIRLFAAALLVAVVGLNFANLVIEGPISVSVPTPGELQTFYKLENPKDLVETIPIYGSTFIGIGVAFASLTSNMSATILVGIRAWSHRRQFKAHVRIMTRRTLAQRVMEILVESGVVYTAIWLLYCISFFEPITVQSLVEAISPYTYAVTHLDVAMAQITSIYPLIIFILVALDKIHCSRGPDTLGDVELPTVSEEEVQAAAVTLDADVQHSTMQSDRSTHETETSRGEIEEDAEVDRQTRPTNIASTPLDPLQLI